MNIYEMVTDRIISKLEHAEKSGEKFRWVKPFDITNGVRYACNYETQIPYTGINRLLADKDEFLTFNQIKKMNEKSKDDFLHIRKGAKGTPILYVNWKEVLDEEGNVKTDKDGDTIIVVYIGHKDSSEKAQFFIKPEKGQLTSDHKDMDPAKILSKIEVKFKGRTLTQEYND